MDAPVPRFADPDRRATLLAALPKIDAAVRQRREQLRMPGLFYGILIDGELVASNTFGVRDVETQAPFTAATISRIASMTKSFTALAILKLRDAGRLGLDDPIAKYVPEAARWEYPTRDTAPITVRQLMMPAEGFPEDVAFTLAPTQPPRVQSLRFDVGRPLSERMRALASDVVAVVNAQDDDAAVGRVFGSSVDARAAREQLRAAHAPYGTCRIGDTVAGDGDTRARIRMECERGKVDAILQRERDERPTAVRLVRASGEACIP